MRGWRALIQFTSCLSIFDSARTSLAELEFYEWVEKIRALSISIPGAINSVTCQAGFERSYQKQWSFHGKYEKYIFRSSPFSSPIILSWRVLRLNRSDTTEYDNTGMMTRAQGDEVIEQHNKLKNTELEIDLESWAYCQVGQRYL